MKKHSRPEFKSTTCMLFPFSQSLEKNFFRKAHAGSITPLRENFHLIKINRGERRNVFNLCGQNTPLSLLGLLRREEEV